MRIAFVVQRYGLEVHGGSESHCRVWAEQLVGQHHVAVFTTCARDYLSWANYYEPGLTTINGVPVERFVVDAPRDIDTFNDYSRIVFGGSHSDAHEQEWMRLQGPYSSTLFAAITARRDDFDLWVFMTYLYCTTYYGLQLVPDKAVLVPTAHDEPPIHLRLFQEMFRLPRYYIYNTPVEWAMLHKLFRIAAIGGSEVGVGVDLPELSAMYHEASPPLLLYIGRIHTSKGCEQLHEYFVRYKQERQSPVQLAFAGRADIVLPPHPDVLMLDFISDERKQQLLADCAVVMMPSPFESLSILCLEAWAAGKPTLVNGQTPVLRDQTLRSNGGLFYQSYDEFATCLDLLLGDAALRRQLGRQGRAFVEGFYSKPIVAERLEAALEQALEVVGSQLQTALPSR